MTGTGNYTGSVEVKWSIATVQITSVEVTSEHIYNDAEQTVTLVVKAGDMVLTADDYTVTGNKATNAGEHTATVIGTGNFAGEISVSWTVQKAIIVVNVDDKLIKHDDQMPELTFTVREEASHGFVPVEKLGITLTTNPAQNSAGQYLPGDYEIIATAAASDNWTVEFNNGVLSVEMGEYICWNTTTGEYFNDVSDALDKARKESGAATIQMLQDATAENQKNESALLIYDGLTLDLNGHTLAADYLVGFAGSQVVDGAGEGILKCKNVRLNADNSQMPVWVAQVEGYRFFTMRDSQMYLSQTASGFVFLSKPIPGNRANTAYMAPADTGLTVKARLSWKSGNDSDVYQMFTLKTEDVTDIYTNDNMVLQLKVWGADAYVGKIYTTTVIESETGVIWMGEGLLYTGE